MANNLYEILLNHFGSEASIARAFDLSRAAYFKKHIPEHIALLCHLDPTIPYKYNPSQYGKNYEGLFLNLALTQKEVTTNEHAIHSKCSA